MTSDRPDQDLLEHLMVLRAQMADHDAYRGLFQRYNARLLYYLRRMVSAADAEDVLQEVWLTVVKKLATLERPEAFKAWIYRIAHNHAISRRRRARPDVALEEAPEVLDIESRAHDDESDSLFASFGAAAIDSGLRRLSPRHREALMLRFVDQHSYQEIAQVVGCTVGTVRSRLHYAKKSLHSYLTQGSCSRREEGKTP